MAVQYHVARMAAVGADAAAALDWSIFGTDDLVLVDLPMDPGPGRPNRLRAHAAAPEARAPQAGRARLQNGLVVSQHVDLLNKSRKFKHSERKLEKVQKRLETCKEKEDRELRKVGKHPLKQLAIVFPQSGAPTITSVADQHKVSRATVNAVVEATAQSILEAQDELMKSILQRSRLQRLSLRVASCGGAVPQWQQCPGQCVGVLASIY